MPDNVVCMQGKLNHFNQDQNMLTSWFANEYSMHFELVLPAMGASESPIPLGGTSNHFKTSILRELGAWDPFNVTEDADLGIRLHREGYRTAMIDSTTLEEANSKVGNWIRQRSRWNKGYYQTWLVHMRHPVQLLRQTGLQRLPVSFNLTMGSAFVLLMNPIFWALTTLYVLTQWGFIEDIYPSLDLLRREPDALRRQLHLHLPQRRRQPAARRVRPDPDRHALAALLGPDELRRLEGLHPALHQPVLLGKDRARSGRGLIA